MINIEYDSYRLEIYIRTHIVSLVKFMSIIMHNNKYGFIFDFKIDNNKIYIIYGYFEEYIKM